MAGALGAIGFGMLCVLAGWAGTLETDEGQCDREVSALNRWIEDCAKARGYDQCREDAPYLHPLPACVRLARKKDSDSP